MSVAARREGAWVVYERSAAGRQRSPEALLRANARLRWGVRLGLAPDGRTLARARLPAALARDHGPKVQAELARRRPASDGGEIARLDRAVRTLGGLGHAVSLDASSGRIQLSLADPRRPLRVEGVERDGALVLLADVARHLHVQPPAGPAGQAAWLRHAAEAAALLPAGLALEEGRLVAFLALPEIADALVPWALDALRRTAEALEPARCLADEAVARAWLAGTGDVTDREP